MGIFDFLRRKPADRQAPPTDHAGPTPGDTPPARGACSCLEHIEDLLDQVVPFSAEMGEPDDEPMTVRDLVECDALAVRRTEPAEQWVNALDADGRVDTTRQDGPFHWTLWVGDEARACYDDDADLSLEAGLMARPGVDRVFWEDREVIHVGVDGLCENGVLAAAARTLLDPRVRIS
jgi:hypothetical protein